LEVVAEREIINLTRKAIAGDRNAFETLIACKLRGIVFNALSILKNHADAEDAAQDAIITMFRSIGKLKDPEAVDSWMYRIVRNRCLRMLERQAKSAGDVDIDDVSIDVVDDDTEFIPEEYAENRELGRELYEIVLSLPEKRRTAIILYYYNGMSLKEIADSTGATINTVSGVIAKARKMIKEELEKRNGIKALVGADVSAPVLSRVLQQESNDRIPDEMLTTLQEKWKASAQTLKYPTSSAAKAGTAIIGKTLGALLAVALFVSGGVYLLNHYADGGAERGGLIAQEAEALGSVVFYGADCDCGHFNPKQADLGGDDAKLRQYDVAWTIVADQSSEMLYEGEGRQVEAPFSDLQAAERYGRYTLTYTCKNKNGDIIKKTRNFEIGQLIQGENPDI
jgi:RNA polymerase sigma factor (sigma-70 family)